MAISRTREFAADETGAKMAGDPLGWSALKKLGMAAERIPLDASPQTCHVYCEPAWAVVRSTSSVRIHLWKSVSSG
jgi:Zn-dependent protease with chaperone function